MSRNRLLRAALLLVGREEFCSLSRTRKLRLWMLLLLLRWRTCGCVMGSSHRSTLLIRFRKLGQPLWKECTSTILLGLSGLGRGGKWDLGGRR